MSSELGGLCSPAVHANASIERDGDEETQLTCLTPAGERIAVVANARQSSNGYVTWSLFSAENRNKLFDELTAARQTLEEQKTLLETLSMTDGLTGLMNRRCFDAALEQARTDVGRTGRPVSVLILDIDNFKAINDTLGHGAGDQVLRELGATLRQISRRNELAARYGGEEFVVLLNGATTVEASDLAERIHTAVTGIFAGGSPITVSIGLSGRSGLIGPSPSELLEEADKAMYAAKRSGKKMTVIWPAVPETSAASADPAAASATPRPR